MYIVEYQIVVIVILLKVIDNGENGYNFSNRKKYGVKNILYYINYIKIVGYGNIFKMDINKFYINMEIKFRKLYFEILLLLLVFIFELQNMGDFFFFVCVFCKYKEFCSIFIIIK